MPVPSKVAKQLIMVMELLLGQQTLCPSSFLFIYLFYYYYFFFIGMMETIVADPLKGSLELLLVTVK